MAVTTSVYDPTTGSTKSVSIELKGEHVAPVYRGNVLTSSYTYYLEMSTSAVDTDGTTLPTKVLTGLDKLALNETKQRIVNTSNNYSDIHTMIGDFVYDYINGHAADLYSSGVTEQKPMDFS